MSAKGLLLATMQPLGDFEAEFNAWYDTEHVPERMAIAGFEAGQRFVCVTGFPRYLALYDLTTLEVMHTPAYEKVAGDNVSPWTHRIQHNTVGRYRFTGTQVYPGGALMGDQGPIVRLLLLRFRNLTAPQEAPLLAALKQQFGEAAGVNQLRLFRSPDVPQARDYVATVDFNHMAAVEPKPGAFGALAKHLDMCNTYQPYWRAA